MPRLSWPLAQLALLAALDLLLLTAQLTTAAQAQQQQQQQQQLDLSQRRLYGAGGTPSAVLGEDAGPCPACNCSNKAIRVYLTLSNYAITVSEAVDAFEGRAGAQDVTVSWGSFHGPEDLGPVQRPPENQSDIYVTEVYRAPVTSFFTPPNFAVDAGSVTGALNRLFLQARDVLDVETVMLFYRRDILEQRGIPVPETWEQLLSVSSALNGTDLNNDTKADYALCFDVDPSCKSSWLLGAIAASKLQYLGTSQGYLIDPSDLQQLLNTTAFTDALHMWQQLTHFNSPPSSCGTSEQQFASGSCLFTLNWAQTMGHTNWTGQRPYATGRTGVAPAPGSTQVYERSTGAMVACTPALCPYATPLHEAKGTSGAGWVNRSPLLSSNLDRHYVLQAAAGVPLDTFFFDMQVKVAFWAMFAVSGPYVLQDFGLVVPGWNVSSDTAYYDSPQFVEDMYAWVQLQRHWVFDPWAAPSPTDAGPLYLAPALYHGLDPLEAAAFVRVSTWGLLHPNAAADPQRSAPLRLLVGTAAAQMALGLNVAVIVEQMSFKLDLWMDPPPGAVFVNTFNATNYRADLGYLLPPAPPQPWPQSPSYPGATEARTQHLGPGAISGIVLGAVAACAVVGLLVYLGLRRRFSTRCDLLGNVLAPGLGCGLTLMVSDVQNSTWLWEQVQADVMERALGVHHEVMRSLLKAHRGYETCTEGDSFIIAFHNPLDALNYSLAVQLAMLSAPWPQQLLEGKEELDVAKDVAQLWLCSHEATARLTPNPGLGLMPEVIVQGSSARPAPAKAHSLHKAACITCTGTRSRAGDSPPPPAPPPSTALRSERGTHQGAGCCSCSALAASEVEGGAQPSASSPQPPTPSPQPPGSSQQGEVVLELLESPASPAAPSDTLKSWLVKCCPRTPPPCDTVPAASPSCSTLAFRGLRIRIGLHSGLSDSRQWQLNTVSGRMCCSGTFVSQCKAVGDTGAGGMVVMSSECGRAVLQRGVPPGALVLHMGEHRLKGQTQEDMERGTALYLGLPIQLVARLAEFPALRSLAPLSPCILDAPVGSATVVFMHVPGVHALLHWNDVLTRAALQVYEEAVSRHLLFYEGYMMELADGSCLAAFTNPGAAIAWALHVQAELLTAAWDPRLLEHELAEEVAVVMPSSASVRSTRWQPYQAGRQPYPAGEPAGTEAAPAAAVSWGAENGTPPSTLDAAHPHLVALHVLDERAAALATPEPPLSLRPRRRSVGFSPDPDPGPRPPAGGGGQLQPLQGEGTPTAKVPHQRSSGHDCVGASAAAGAEGAHTHARLSSVAALSRMASYVSSPSVKKKVIMRGLRIKAGLDTGAVKFSVSPSTGRMAYFGKVMNRSARISVMATSGQVLCSVQTFFSAGSSLWLQQRPVMGLSMGQHKLKGIPSPMEIVQCTLEDSGGIGRRSKEE